ncbi:TetR/AcrR family transcriptional regulator [Streptomyces sp. NPDC056600]|uniref:TetR/AcrR family transcriptional regulator n=1 Tax=Streptomyces sp. NPDC056600 TaxID=3345874 RepID=UPI0036B436F4
MTAQPTGPRRGRGRPPRASASAETPAARDRILTAAREVFAERGYEKASVRGIAKAADVDPALVHHYFGTKEQVFESAVEGAFAPVLRTQPLTDLRPDRAGEQFVRMFLGIWENPATRAPLLAIIRSAVSNEAAAAIFRRLVAGLVLSKVAKELDAPDAELRAELAAAQVVGVVMLRYVIKVEPIASADPEELIARLAPVLQHHLTGSPGAPAAG